MHRNVITTKESKKEMARPTKLTEEARQTTIEYLRECVEGNEIPTAARLAVKLDVAKSTLYYWAESDKEFSDTLDKLQSIQEANLIDGSLKNKLNPTISKLMLANHGYKERQDITTDDEKIGVQISADQAEQLLRARAGRSDT